MFHTSLGLKDDCQASCKLIYTRSCGWNVVCWTLDAGHTENIKTTKNTSRGILCENLVPFYCSGYEIVQECPWYDVEEVGTQSDYGMALFSHCFYFKVFILPETENYKLSKSTE